MIGREAAHGGLDRGVAQAGAGGEVLVDLVDQDDRVAHDDAGERDDAEDGDEAEGGVGHDQRRHRADEAERRRQQDEEPLAGGCWSWNIHRDG